MDFAYGAKESVMRIEVMNEVINEGINEGIKGEKKTFLFQGLKMLWVRYKNGNIINEVNEC